jgi:glyoxylase I family protein
MSVDHVLAVVPVADFEAAHAWYERFFGRPADYLPMAGRLAEWRLTDSEWVQVTSDAERAGTALLNLAVDDLDQHIAGIRGRGMVPGATSAPSTEAPRPGQVRGRQASPREP